MSGEVIQVHPSERVELPDGGEADIDVQVLPLVRRLWSLGLSTTGSCQDFGEAVIANGHGSATAERDRRRHADFYHGYVWLKMPLEDARELITLLGEDPVFGHRVRRWTHPEAWMNICYVFPDEHGEKAAVTPAVQLHFPNRQLPELLTALRSHE